MPRNPHQPSAEPQRQSDQGRAETSSSVDARAFGRRHMSARRCSRGGVRSTYPGAAFLQAPGRIRGSARSSPGGYSRRYVGRRSSRCTGGGAIGGAPPAEVAAEAEGRRGRGVAVAGGGRRCLPDEPLGVCSYVRGCRGCCRRRGHSGPLERTKPLARTIAVRWFGL